ncbi:ABC transporter substrate-binding protein [Candidatus Corynebacterium faecigallinarum]|uniref:ABC transporter substrate-binding protein n=1 Tax=Candidatus Corynebacterium faecigallinarum TaxID=2838528 RepID=UPI0009D99E36
MTIYPDRKKLVPSPLRTMLGLLMSLTVVAMGASCSNSDDSSKSSDDASYYPHVMEMKNGSTTIPEAPEKVLAIGAVTASSLQDLGVMPIATADNPDTLPVQMPWLSEEIINTTDDTLRTKGEYNFEKILELEPDLIVAPVTAISNMEDFERLNAIAPTISANSDQKLTNWQDQFLAVAESVNKESQARDMISEIEDRYSSAGKNLGMNGKTYTFASYTESGFKYGNGTVLEMLGLSPAEHQDNNGQSLISDENISELGADFMFIWPYPDDLLAKLGDIPGFLSLSENPSHSVYYMDYPKTVAINDTEPTALNWLLDNLQTTGF